MLARRIAIDQKNAKSILQIQDTSRAWLSAMHRIGWQLCFDDMRSTLRKQNLNVASYQFTRFHAVDKNRRQLRRRARKRGRWRWLDLSVPIVNRGYAHRYISDRCNAVVADRNVNHGRYACRKYLLLRQHGHQGQVFMTFRDAIDQVEYRRWNFGSDCNCCLVVAVGWSSPCSGNRSSSKQPLSRWMLGESMAKSVQSHRRARNRANLEMSN